MADQLTLFQPGGTDFAQLITTGTPKEVVRTCNVLPFSCTHLALWRGKKPKVLAKQKGFKNFFRLFDMKKCHDFFLIQPTLDARAEIIKMFSFTFWEK